MLVSEGFQTLEEATGVALVVGLGPSVVEAQRAASLAALALELLLQPGMKLPAFEQRWIAKVLFAITIFIVHCIW